MKAVLSKFHTPGDIALQVTDMVREAVDNALRHLKVNGGGAVANPQGYTHAARTADEIKASIADAAGVPANQRAETAGMPEDLAEIVNAIPEPEGEPEIVIPKEGLRGWSY